VGPRRTILCVDDNEDFVSTLCGVLEHHGYHGVPAASCAQALSAAEAGFDVAVVDVRLPDGDGTTLARRLRELAPDGQIIMLTGFASLESAAAAVRAGAFAYLVKPCAVPDLLLSIGDAVGQVALREEKRELQRRAQVAEKLAAIGTLTAGLSHEIKNPLNAATLQLKVLESRLRRVSDDVQPSLRQPLELVQDEIARLSRLLEEFLEFARPREVARVEVQLGNLVANVLDLLAVEADKAGVALLRAWEGQPSALGDEERLRQVVLNLVRNAIQATPAGGWVRVELRETDAEVRLVVEDSGAGVPDELRQRIFEPFFTTKATGSGLGLPLVHTIVEQHRGALSLERGEAGGARFVVALARKAGA
jgi:two-component system, NtrC family, sensor histidine kinase HydH